MFSQIAVLASAACSFYLATQRRRFIAHVVEVHVAKRGFIVITHVAATDDDFVARLHLKCCRCPSRRRFCDYGAEVLQVRCRQVGDVRKDPGTQVALHEPCIEEQKASVIPRDPAQDLSLSEAGDEFGHQRCGLAEQTKILDGPRARRRA